MNEVVLPEGWIYTKLEKCVDILDGMRQPINNTERQQRISGKRESELFPYYGATGEVGKIDDYIFDEELIALGEDGVPFLDAGKNKAYLLIGKTWVNNHAHVLRGIKGLAVNKFILNFLNIFEYQGYVNGGTRLKLTQANMRQIPIPLPPLAEQKVIADKLDSLLAQVDNIKTRLDALPNIIKRFKQSVLSAAVSGKLTEDWRNFEETNVHWRSLVLSDIAISVTYGYTASSSQEPIGTKMLRITDIQDGKVNWDTVPYCQIDEDKKDNYLLQKGDLVFARTGATVGKSFLIKDVPCEAVYASYLIRVRCNAKNAVEYLSLFFQSNNYWEQITDFAAGIGQPNVNGTKLKSLLIPIPPLEEQTEIVRRVEQLFAYADQIEQQVKNAQNRVNNLTQSILAKAFRGELTADWRAANPHLISGENSAQALLAKIKAERDKPKKNKQATSHV